MKMSNKIPNSSQHSSQLIQQLGGGLQIGAILPIDNGLRRNRLNYVPVCRETGGGGRKMPNRTLVKLWIREVRPKTIRKPYALRIR